MSYQTDLQTERQKKWDQHEVLTYEVTACLGEGWSVLHHPTNAEDSIPTRMPDIVHTDGRSFDLELCDYPTSDRGKVQIRANWPLRDGENCPRVTPASLHNPEECYPSIKVSISRGAKTIAKEIERRFLPEYTRILGRVQEKIRLDDEFEAGREAVFARLRSEVELPERPPHSSELMTRYYGGDAGCYGRIIVNSPESVTIDFHSIPPDVAIRALKILCEKR